MDFIFKLKAWQLFLIWAIAFILLRIFLNTEFALVNLITCVFIYYSWLFAVSKILSDNKILPNQIRVYWILLMISTIIFGFQIDSVNTISNTFSNPTLIIIAGLVANVALFKINVYTAKAIKKNETNVEWEAKDVIWEIVSLYFYFYSIWFLHPRVKKIVSKID